VTETAVVFQSERSTPRSVDEMELAELHDAEEIEVTSDDGWTLVVTRYRPRAQPFPQPLRGVPLLLVHGYTQNRRAWSSGEFVKNMLFFGADLFLLELRGHGKSTPELTRRRARARGAEPPRDLDYGWNLDSHLLFDLPAAVAAVKQASGREKIFYCGHSLGGILGYAYATLFDDLSGLITIGSPSDFARLPLWLRALSFGPPLAFPALDLLLAAANAGRLAGRALRRLPRWSSWRAGRGAASSPVRRCATTSRRRFRASAFRSRSSSATRIRWRRCAPRAACTARRRANISCGGRCAGTVTSTSRWATTSARSATT